MTPLARLVLGLVASKINYEVEFDQDTQLYLVSIHGEDGDGKSLTFNFKTDGQREI